jgi:CHAT domain-containing protein
MRHPNPMTARVLSALLALICTAPLFAAEAPEDVARRFVTLAYEGNFDALPKSSTADTQKFERRAKNILRVRAVKIESLAVRGVTAEGDAATALFDVTLHKTERPPAGNWQGTDTFPLRVKLARENGEWLVSAAEFPNAEIAEKLVAASEEERKQLLAQHTSKNLGRMLYERGMTLLNLGKFAEAAKAGSIAKEIAVATGDVGGEVLAMCVLVFTGEDDEIRTLAIQALELARTVQEPDVLARVWYNRGRAYVGRGGSVRGQISVAQIDTYRTAARFAERAEDPIMAVRIYYSLANIAASHSDYVMARQYIDRVLPVAREIGDTIGETTLHTVLATIYFDQGDRELGMFHHNRALQLAEKDRSYAYTTLLLRKAVMLENEGNLKEARAIYDKVLVRTPGGEVRATGPTPSGHVATGIIHIAELEADSGNFSEAECLLRESARLYKVKETTFLHELARHYLDRNDPHTALRYALATFAEKDLYRTEQIGALMTVAKASRALGRIDDALEAVVEAIELREVDTATIAGRELQRAQVAEQTAAFYSLAAEIEAERGRPAEALAYLERGRASVLTDILEHGRPGTMTDVDDANEEERRRREQELARLSVELDRARIAQDQAAIEMWTERLHEARAENDTFLDGLRARTERRNAPRRYFDGSGLIARMKDLPPGVAGVEYLVGDQRLDIFVLRSGAHEVVHRQVAVAKKSIEEQATRFVDQLARRDVNVHQSARDLYKLLIEPIERDLGGAETLLLVPDGALWRVPFAALSDRNERFLVERWASVYAPSLTAYAMIARSKREMQPRPPVLFAVGNPKIDLASKEAVTGYYRDADLNPLPDAEREVDNLRAIYDRRQSTVLKGAQATETRTKSSVGDATVVHFATHGLFDDANPMYSRLALARDENARDDGWLESWEVAQLDLDADMVVLSACETARGRVRRGEGVTGMAWSFFVAGAHSTVASQWRVASSSTADLMVAFHRALRANTTGDPVLVKAHALRNAQLNLLRDRRSRHPYYWAPFVLFGS